MTPQDHLRQAIERQQDRLRAEIPSDRQAATLALIRARDRPADRATVASIPDLVTGCRLPDLGGNLALRLNLETADVNASDAPTSTDGGLDGWAEPFLRQCGHLAEANLALAHVETGFMRLVGDGGTFHAWVATKLTPASWRERADIDWWAGWLAGHHEPELRSLRSARPDPAGSGLDCDAHYRRLADVHLKMLAYQLGYPPEAVIDGCPMQTYHDVLRLLIGWALQARDRGEAARPVSEPALISALGSALDVDSVTIAQVVAAFTLDRENASWHAAVPGVAPAPLVRIDPDRLVWSVHGLTSEPLFFLTRELRRRDAQDYHNSAYLREEVFRRDLYALFADKRFVTSASRIALRRDTGAVRTDIDAAVFDRKTGALGIFELKSHDPFARSSAELARQRDNVLYANRQVSGALAWLQRYGGDTLLGRFDAPTAKRFRVQKVYPFVLGRYLAHFSDGPPPDPRAAWGTWPQLLRLLDRQPLIDTANPLASLFSRLAQDAPSLLPPTGTPAREIAIGEARLIVHSSYAAFQASKGRR